MSGKRLMTNAVNYTELFQRCPQNQQHYLQIVKERARSYLEKIHSLPPEKPEINWDYYKTHVRKEYVPMVEEFQRKYTEYQIPRPKDIYQEELDQLSREAEEEFCKYIGESNERIENFERQICYLQGLIPFDQMTMEDFVDAFPNDAPDFINRPTFWPHTKEEQLELPKEEIHEAVELEMKEKGKENAKQK